MAEATAFRNNALPYPIYGQTWTVVFPMLDADGDLVTGATTPDAERSLNGDTFADCTNESTEIATNSGMYYLTLTAAEMTADIVSVIAKSATAGMKTTAIVLYPRKLVTIRSGTCNDDGSGTGDVVLDASASAVDDFYNGMVIAVVIDGAASAEVRVITDYVGSTKTATVTPGFNTAVDNTDTFIIYLTEGPQLNQANVSHWNSLATVELPLVPTTAGRKLDVSATGEAGVDWANVGSPTTSLALTGTTIATTQKVDIETIKTNPVVNGGTITFPTTATLASTTNITAGTVTTATNVTTVNGLAANVITATAINNDAITAAKIADGAIDAATFAASAITATAIAADAITAAKIADAAIDAATFAAGAITATVIADGAIDAATFAASAIDATAIASDAITAAKIANGAIDRATFAADTGMLTIRSNTAQAGAGTTITLDASASAVDDFYNNTIIFLTGGTGAGQARFVSDYVGATKVATVPTWVTNPDNTTTFAIMPFGAIPGATAPTAAEVADAVWDEAIAGHAGAGSTGEALSDAGAAGTPPTAAEVADAVWDEATAGHTTSGTFGEQVKTDIDAILVDTGTTLDGKIDTIDTVVDAILVDTGTTLDTAIADLPTNAELSTALGTADDATLAAIAALNNPSTAQIASAVLTTQMTEAYAANGVAPTLAQAMFAVQQYLTMFAINTTTYSVKKLDGSTEAFVVTLNDGTTPTAATRA